MELVRGPVTWDAQSAPVISDERATAGHPAQIKTQLNYDGRIEDATLFDLFMHFMPMEKIDATTKVMDEKGRAKYGRAWTAMTRGLLLRWIGVWFEMLANPRAGGRRQYWISTKTHKSNCPSQYSFEHIMPVSQFEQIYCVFELAQNPPTLGDDTPTDPFAKVRRWVDACNRCWKGAFTPGLFLVVDESMIFWSGRGMPGWIVIPRKPRSTGLEGKTTCCGQTNILLHFDPQEGKHRMGDMEFNDVYQRSTGCTLRCVKFWFGSGRIVIADSWFGSVRTCIALLDHGLYCVMNVKTATKYYVKDWLLELYEGERDEVHACGGTVTINGIERRIFASVQREKSPIYLIASCTSTLPGSERKFTVRSLNLDGSEEANVVTYKSTQAHYTYRTKFNSVDVHNRSRQGEPPVSDIWMIDSWSNRVFGEFHGMIRTNGLFAARSFHPNGAINEMLLNEFADTLAYELVNNPYYQGGNAGPSRAPGAAGGVCKLCELPPLDGTNRKTKRQTTCRYCGADCSHYCPKCSIAASSGQHIAGSLRTFYGICNSAMQGCWWGLHERSETPSKQQNKRPEPCKAPGASERRASH